MAGNEHSKRIAESLVRFEGAAVEDFESRNEAGRMLGESLDWLLISHIDWDEVGNYLGMDGVSATTVVRTGPHVFELEADLWLLDGVRNWSVPLFAIFELSDDGFSVDRYELMFGSAAQGVDPGPGVPVVGVPVPRPDRDWWLFAFRSPDDL